MIGTYTGNNGVNHGFLDRHEVFTTFNVPGAGTGSGQGTVGAVINNHGVIAGIYIDAHGVLHGYLGRRGHFTTIDHPYAGTQQHQGTSLGSINDRGIVSGSYRDRHGNHFSFTGRPGPFTPVNDPHAPPFSTFVGGINNSGLITGGYLDTNVVASSVCIALVTSTNVLSTDFSGRAVLGWLSTRGIWTVASASV